MNYEGYWRTNYVRFRPGMREALVAVFGITSAEKDGRWALFGVEGGGLPSAMFYDCPVDALRRLDIDPNAVKEGDSGEILDFLPEALIPGEHMVAMEVGREGMRYLVGQSVHITSEGIQRTVDLNDIYTGLPDAVGSCAL